VTDPLVLQGPEGSITIAPAALARLVVRAAQTVDGAIVRRPKRSVEVARGPTGAVVTLGLSVRFGARIPDVALGVQERVAQAVAATSGLAVERVDVRVKEVA
jgi:uncharacterized alkaline shock family protein YloU